MSAPLAGLTPQRLLIIRLDRLGDVILSTPVFRALRRAFPHTVLTAMVSPACLDIVDGHPDLDAVLPYDKEGIHQSAAETYRFARALRRSRFDAALVLHPSNRSHWIPWIAGIPVRVGYDRKSPWLLTHRIPHRKQEGKRHEAAYTLDMLEVFGIRPGEPELSVPRHADAEARIQALLQSEAPGVSGPWVAIHPSASCVSKRWMPERFAAVADKLSLIHGARICLIAGKVDAPFAKAVEDAMREPSLNLAGRLPVRDTAALLRRCTLLVSNDSGPVHLAAAVGTPVVAIFGRNQAGLSPLRWGPLGKKHVILHKEVGCDTCLAHKCVIEFKCLTELPVDEVYAAAVSLLPAGQKGRPSGLD